MRPHLARAIGRYDSLREFVDDHKHLGIHERMVWSVLKSDHKSVSMSTADKLVTAIDPMLWHGELADLLPQLPAPVKPSGRLKIP